MKCLLMIRWCFFFVRCNLVKDVDVIFKKSRIVGLHFPNRTRGIFLEKQKHKKLLLKTEQTFHTTYKHEWEKFMVEFFLEREKKINQHHPGKLFTIEIPSTLCVHCSYFIA